MTLKKVSFSFSAISTFQSCPRAFKYKYIDQLPEAFTSIEAFMGTCVHVALEWAYTQRQEGYEPTMDMALEQYKHTWNNGDFQGIKIVKEDQSKENYYNQGREFLASFFQRVFPFDSSTTVFLEHQFELPLGEEIKLKGVIDRIAKETDGKLRVTDYKTGRVGHPLDTLQLPSYALYIFQHNIDQEIHLCYEDLRQQRTVVVSYDRKEAKKAKEELLNEIQRIRNTELEDFVTNPSILCLWCGYNHICDNPHESVKQEGIDMLEKNELLVNSPSGEYQEACPQCGGELHQRSGKFGPFLGCRNYPECRYTRDLSNSSSALANNPNIEGKDICPECGSLLKKRSGKFGDFMGCSSFPECRFTRPL